MDEENNKSPERENQETNQSYPYGSQENQETNQSYQYGYQQNNQQYGYQNQGYNQNYYGANGNSQQYYKPVSGFAVAALVMGILSLLLACCSGIGGIMAGALGIIFAILSRKGQPMEMQAKVGLGTSIAGLVFGIVIIMITFVYISTGKVNVQKELQNELRNELGRYGYEFDFGDDDYDEYDDYDDYNDYNHYDNHYGDDFHETNEL